MQGLGLQGPSREGKHGLVCTSADALAYDCHGQVGTVPSGLCRHNKSSSLANLLIANNQLTGSLTVPFCDQLGLLDAAVGGGRGLARS